MNPSRSRSVLRYFLPADAFVRVHAVEACALEVRSQPELNRTSYRRAVIQACCPDLGPDVAHALGEISPLDPPAAEDLLYQLCVEVNPHLDIHTVKLPDPREPRGEQVTLGRELAEAAQVEDLRLRLARRARGLEERLAKRVVGQDRALAAVARAVRKAAVGLAEEMKPLGSFLFVGRTGTGKTELAKALAAELFEAQARRLVRVDCSEFGLSHEYAKLIGAPPGYVGHEHGGVLTEAVRREPQCVVLFDEIEKAHAKLHHLLLQILDEAELTDSRGRKVDFSQTLIVLTSNVGATELQSASQRVGFGSEATLDERTSVELLSRALEAHFPPEFLGRIGERVYFRDLDRGNAIEIAQRLLGELGRRARRRGVVVAFADPVAEWVAERGFRPESGARELLRVVRAQIEDPLAQHLLSEGLGQRPLLRVTIRHGRPRIARQA